MTAQNFENRPSDLVDVCGEPVVSGDVECVHVCYMLGGDCYVFVFKDGSALLYERDAYSGYPASGIAYDSLAEVPEHKVLFTVTGYMPFSGDGYGWRVARSDDGGVYVSFTERREYLDETVRWFDSDDEYSARYFAYQLAEFGED